MILLQANDLIQEGLQITPGSATAYGALVVALAVAVVFLWRKLAVVEKEFRDVMQTTVELLTKVSGRLEDQQEMSNVLQDIRKELEHIKQNFMK